MRLWDLARGTGAVVASFYDKLREEKQEEDEEARLTIKVLAVDVSPAMVEYVRERGAREGWGNALNLVTDVVDATVISFFSFPFPSPSRSSQPRFHSLYLVLITYTPAILLI